VSQRDLEVVRKILQQICVAYAPEGGAKVRHTSSSSSSIAKIGMLGQPPVQHATTLCMMRCNSAHYQAPVPPRQCS
jgi:hypothetical protein